MNSFYSYLSFASFSDVSVKTWEETKLYLEDRLNRWNGNGKYHVNAWLLEEKTEEAKRHLEIKRQHESTSASYLVDPTFLESQQRALTELIQDQLIPQGRFLAKKTLLRYIAS